MKPSVPEDIVVQYQHFRYTDKDVNRYHEILFSFGDNPNADEREAAYEEWAAEAIALDGKEASKPENIISPCGGITVCQLLMGKDKENMEVVVEAQAICSPLENFNRRIGRDISLGRALKEYHGKGPQVALVH